jgi:acid phosphatase (class A)
MNLDNLKYGNPREEHVKKIAKDKGGVLRGALKAGIIQDIIQNYPPPKNSSSTTKKELEYLDTLTDSLSNRERRFCEVMEDSHYKWFQKIGEKLGITTTADELKELVSKVDPVIFYLKWKFNRPRPYQLAGELEIPLHPVIATDANSAAYPSGHTMDFLIIIHNFKKKKPELGEKLDELYKKVRHVREMSGVHYPSDRKISEILFKKLLDANLI